MRLVRTVFERSQHYEEQDDENSSNSDWDRYWKCSSNYTVVCKVWLHPLGNSSRVFWMVLRNILCIVSKQRVENLNSF